MPGQELVSDGSFLNLKDVMRKLWIIFSMKCDQASHLASESMDRPLQWHERVGMKIHRALCQSCRQFAKQLATVRSAFQHLSHDPQDASKTEPVQLSDEVKARIKSKL